MAKVLVVDDEPDIRSVVGTLLEDAGYAVVLACDGAAALECVRLAPPDCVLLDLHMPRMDGATFLAAWRAERRYRKVPVVLFTTEADAVKVAAALEVQACVSKPFDLDDVTDTISRVLGASVTGPREAVIQPVDGIRYPSDGLPPPAWSPVARPPAQVAALRERAHWTRQAISRSQRTIVLAEECLGRAGQLF